jgi:hypothetical protein
MPRISEFYGILVYMYYRDHAPPHFHAIYGFATQLRSSFLVKLSCCLRTRFGRRQGGHVTRLTRSEGIFTTRVLVGTSRL